MEPSESQLCLSWSNSAWIPVLNQQNVLEYFSQKSNPFYDRTCNNEIIKMQRLDSSHLLYLKDLLFGGQRVYMKMTGTEYMLLHVQDPILYVIRKAYRHSRDKVTPLADYYILGGVVYQCPDLQAVINSRMLSTLHLLNSAFDEARSYSRYSPGRSYHWEFPKVEKEKVKKEQEHEEVNTELQFKRVDIILSELVKQFPVRAVTDKEGGKPVDSRTVSESSVVKNEPLKRTNSGGLIDAKRKRVQ